VRVSPGAGSRSSVATRSRLTLPTTVTVLTAPSHHLRQGVAPPPVGLPSSDDPYRYTPSASATTGRSSATVVDRVEQGLLTLHVVAQYDLVEVAQTTSTSPRAKYVARSSCDHQESGTDLVMVAKPRAAPLAIGLRARSTGPRFSHHERAAAPISAPFSMDVNWS
jgi:hypothetical protein